MRRNQDTRKKATPQKKWVGSAKETRKPARSLNPILGDHTVSAGLSSPFQTSFAEQTPGLDRVSKTVSTLDILGMREQAEKLAFGIRQTHPSVERIIWFPHNSELRILEIDPNAIKAPTRVIEPFYFDATASLPVPCGIAIIRPEDYGSPDVLPPKDWGRWEDGQELKVENE